MFSPHPERKKDKKKEKEKKIQWKAAYMFFHEFSSLVDWWLF